MADDTIIGEHVPFYLECNGMRCGVKMEEIRWHDCWKINCPHLSMEPPLQTVIVLEEGGAAC